MKNIQLFLKTTLVMVLTLGGINAWAGLYTITGVPVAAERATALQAKEAALAEGQVVAFNRLMTRLAGEKGLTQVPKVTEESVLDYVLGVSIEKEKTTATRYTGSIAVEFNPDAIKSLMSDQSVPYLKDLPPSLLVVPQYTANGQTLTISDSNPLYRSLKNQNNFAPFYEAVVPGAEDADLVNQAFAGGSALTALLQSYGKDRLMLLQMEPESADTWIMNTSFLPRASMEKQIIVKKFKMSGGDMQVASGQMAGAVFTEMESRWRNDRTDRFQEKQVLYLRVPVNSLAEWQRLEQQMKSWTFFDKLEMRGLYLPQVLLEAVYQGDENDIADKLASYGWQLNKDSSGNGATLTRRIVYE